jgi:hypothetical protein
MLMKDIGFNYEKSTADRKKHHRMATFISEED